MKKLTTLFIAIIMMAGFTARVMAQSPITQTVTNDARAEVLNAIGLTAVNILEFGGFSSSGTAGTVVLTPLSVRTATGGVTLVTTSTTPTAASYTMTGSPSTHYNIVLPTGNIMITRVGNSATMAVNTFTCSYASLSSTTTTAGTDAFTVGATLNVAASQLPGTYVGPFDVSVVY